MLEQRKRQTKDLFYVMTRKVKKEEKEHRVVYEKQSSALPQEKYFLLNKNITIYLNNIGKFMV